MSHSNKSFSTTVPLASIRLLDVMVFFRRKYTMLISSEVSYMNQPFVQNVMQFFHEGRWQWLPAPANAHKEMCSACHRIHDHYPAGFLTLEGPFFLAHREEIMHLVHHEEKYQRAEHPVKRIMEIDEKPDSTLITTTDIHLARGMGEKIHDSYQGELEFHYNPEETCYE